jgi:hypothetical protein
VSDIVLQPGRATASHLARVVAALQRVAERRPEGWTLSPGYLHHQYDGPAPHIVGIVLRQRRAEVEDALGREVQYMNDGVGMMVILGAAR